ncbi:MAG: YgiT-type zinc finger protein [Candidatus Sulfotelmatobacter sp.]
MTTYPCPECGRGTVEKTTRKNFRTKVRGYPFEVPEAVIGVCNDCGKEFFGASQVKRWARLYDELCAPRSRPLVAENITRIRDRLRLTMGGFALFLGCTRQTIHNWERKDRKVPQLGMADLLLRLVEESSRRGAVDVVSWLRNRAHGLGVEIEPAVCRHGDSSESPGEEIEFLPAEDYEKLFIASGTARELPTLIQ